MAKEDDDLFQEIAEATSDEAWERENCPTEPTVDALIPPVRDEPSPSPTPVHSVMPTVTDSNNSINMGPVSENGKGELDTKEAGGPDAAESIGQPMKAAAVGKSGAVKKGRTGRKKRP